MNAIASWCGWFGCIFFTTHPNKYPLKSMTFKNPYMILSILVHLIASVILSDAAIKFTLNQNKTMLTKILSLLYLFVLVYSNKILWAIMLFKRESLIQLLNLLQSIQNGHHSQTKISTRRSWTFYKFYNNGTFIFRFIISALISFVLYQRLSLLEMYLKFTYIFTFVFFGAFTLVCSHFFLLSLIITSTFGLVWSFENFCQDLENFIDVPKGKLFHSGCEDYQMWKIQYLEKFDDLMSIFRKFDEICGPIFFSETIIIAFGMTNSTNNLIYSTLTSKATAVEYINFIIEVTVTLYHGVSILELGHIFAKRIQARKLQLRKKLALHTQSKDLKQLTELILDFKWKLTASEYFVIDRDLIFSILAALLSYLVILFQLHSAEF